MAAKPPRYNITALEPRAGRTQAMPDDRILLTLDDGRAYVIDAERLDLQADGTYRVELTSADERWQAVTSADAPRAEGEAPRGH